MEIRQHPENPGVIAVETGPSVTVGDWFYFDQNNGGHYTNGEYEGIADWPLYGTTPPAPPE
jgi:hypothetical protein